MKKIGFIAIIGLVAIFLIIPFGRCAETKHLNVANYVNISLNAQEGDVIRGDYRTYSSPFLVGVRWQYLENIVVISVNYESGWFEIEILEDSGVNYITLMNVDFSYLRSGYIEYTITNPKGEERLMLTIIIGIVVGIIGISITVGVCIHYKNKKLKIVENGNI